jgi:hypothetical protein
VTLWVASTNIGAVRSVPFIPGGLACRVLVKILPDSGWCRLSREPLVWDSVTAIAVGRWVEWPPTSSRQFLIVGAVMMTSRENDG